MPRDFQLPPGHRPFVLSASQIDTFGNTCERKWSWRHLAGVKEPPNRYAARGLELHDIGEKWLRDGTPPPETDAGKVFKASIPHLPFPGVCRVEQGFWWEPEGEEFGIIGFKDFAWDDNGVPCVGDHKSTSDPQWAKTPDDLRSDVQATIYLRHALLTAGAERARALWSYCLWQPKRPKSWPVRMEMTRGELDASWQEIAETARRIVRRLKDGTHPLGIPYRVSGCEAYGGCPYQLLCALPAQERMKSYMEAEMSLKQKLAARQGINPPEAALIPNQGTVPGNGGPPPGWPQGYPFPLPAGWPMPPMAAHPAPAPAPAPQLVQPPAFVQPPPVQVAPPVPPVQAAPPPMPVQMSMAMHPPVQAPMAALVSAEGPNRAALAAACEDIGAGFLAIAKGLRG